jgi:hypothetical protein
VTFPGGEMMVEVSRGLGQVEYLMGPLVRDGDLFVSPGTNP